MRRMTNEQIDKLNELLVDHAETLTAFYDEGLGIGARKGAIGATIGIAITAGIIYSVKKLKSKMDKTKTIKEES
jgi:hypothetical protein